MELFRWSSQEWCVEKFMYEVQKKREMRTWFWWDNLKERNHLEQRRTGGGSNTPPPPEIPKALQNRARLNPIVKPVKNCWI